jgi:hypothetical protein
MASPYLGAAGSISATDAAAPAMQQGADLASASTQDLGMQAASPYLTAAGNISAQQAAQPGFEQANQLTGASTQALGIGMASPYLGQAAGMSAANAARCAGGTRARSTRTRARKLCQRSGWSQKPISRPP